MKPILWCRDCRKSVSKCQHQKLFEQINVLRENLKFEKEPPVRLVLLSELAALQKQIQVSTAMQLDIRIAKYNAMLKLGMCDEVEALLWREIDMEYPADELERNREKAAQERKAREEADKKAVETGTADSAPHFHPGEFFDFQRNLYRRRIYAKMRIFYRQQRIYDRAAVFALLEQYCNCEHILQRYDSGWYSLPMEEAFEAFSGFDKVMSVLNKSHFFDLSEEIKQLYKMYFLPDPDQEQCMRLYQAVRELLERRRDDVVRFTCPECTQKYEGNRKNIGKKTKCTFCKKSNVLDFQTAYGKDES